MLPNKILLIGICIFSIISVVYSDKRDEFNRYISESLHPKSLEDAPVIDEREGPKLVRPSPPITYSTLPRNDLFIYTNGLVAFDVMNDENLYDYSYEDAIAVFYIPNLECTTRYLESSLSNKSRKSFWELVDEDPSYDVRLTSQLVVKWTCYSSNTSSPAVFYLVLVYGEGVAYAAAYYPELGDITTKPVIGFFVSDGRRMEEPASIVDGRVVLSESVAEANNMMLYCISDLEPEPMKKNPDYEDEGLNENDECPRNPYGDNCPDGCEPLTDSRGCMLCICSNIMGSSELQPGPENLPESSPEVPLTGGSDKYSTVEPDSSKTHPFPPLIKRPEICDVKADGEKPPECNYGEEEVYEGIDQPEEDKRAKNNLTTSDLDSNVGDIEAPKPKTEESQKSVKENEPTEDDEQQRNNLQKNGRKDSSSSPIPQQPRKPSPYGYDSRFAKGYLNLTEQDYPGRVSYCNAAMRQGPVCHPNARCRDYQAGFCCECIEGYYGNGQECLKEDEDQRVSGLLSGEINGVELKDKAVRMYTNGKKGQTYFALIDIPVYIGPALSMIDEVAAIFGWLFAKPESPDTYNGFELTGGVLNHTATIYIDKQYGFKCQQIFTGRDSTGVFGLQMIINGTIPHIDDRAHILQTGRNSLLRRASPGYVYSMDEYVLTVQEQASERLLNVVAEHRIYYTECRFKQFNKQPILRVKRDRLRNVYDDVEKTVRYASENRALAQDYPNFGHSPAGRLPLNPYARMQPKAANQTGRGQYPDDRRYPLPGPQYPYEHTYYEYPQLPRLPQSTFPPYPHQPQQPRQPQQQPYPRYPQQPRQPQQQPYPRYPQQQRQPQQQPYPNYPQQPQQPQQHPYPHYPQQPQQPRVYQNQSLQPNYTHPGYKQPNVQSEDDPCAPGRHQCIYPHMRCLNSEGKSKCLCENGYTIVLKPNSTDMGWSCEIMNRECRTNSDCHKYAECVEVEPGRKQCKCRSWYTGDGITHCGPPEQASRTGHGAGVKCGLYWCHKDAICITSASGVATCKCKPGYKGNGVKCASREQMLDKTGTHSGVKPGPVTCDANCGPNAVCEYDARSNRFGCRCVNGYASDGITCSQKRPVVELSPPPPPPSSPLKPNVASFCRDMNECHPNAHCVFNGDYKQYVCECLNGFEGDGVRECRPVAECNPKQPQVCSPHAKCEYDEDVRAFKCKCNQGYKGDGIKCVESLVESCQQNPAICHPEAQCIYNQSTQRHECVCKTGWYGDGYRFCGMLQNQKCELCSTNARCAIAADGGYECECLPGYEGNGQVCSPAVSCLNDNSMCDKNARCVLAEKDRYVCNCNYGYVGDGRVCKPGSQGNEMFLVARGVSIIKRDMNPEIIGKQMIISFGQALVGLGYDCKEKRIYYTDIKGPVHSAMWNGSDVRKVLTLPSPEGIAIDSASRNFYYVVTKSDGPEIGVASLDGRYRKTLAKEGLVQPRYLALDMKNKYLYYSDWHRSQPKIGRMHLDGSGHETFVDTGLGMPHGIALLEDRDELCWVDASKRSLECIGVHNKRRRTVYAPLGYPYGLAVHHNRKFFWTDGKDNKIHSVSVDGSGYNNFPITHGSSVTKPYGLIIVNPSSCQEEYSPCAVNNGGCPYLCLPSSNGALCVNPDNLQSPERP